MQSIWASNKLCCLAASHSLQTCWAAGHVAWREGGRKGKESAVEDGDLVWFYLGRGSVPSPGLVRVRGHQR